MPYHGFVRVGAAVPALRVADTEFNADRVITICKALSEGGVLAATADVRSRKLALDGDVVPFGTDLLFDAADVEGLLVGIEICEDLWVPIPPSSLQALNGASVLLNPSASNE